MINNSDIENEDDHDNNDVDDNDNEYDNESDNKNKNDNDNDDDDRHTHTHCQVLAQLKLRISGGKCLLSYTLSYIRIQFIRILRLRFGTNFSENGEIFARYKRKVCQMKQQVKRSSLRI